MAYGMQVFDSSGALVWDSSTVLGGCAIDYREIPVSTAVTYEYPAHAGRSVALQAVDGDNFQLLPTGTAGTYGVTVDTTLGYPRVTVASASFVRRFIVFADL